jgi:hypothetical protein
VSVFVWAMVGIAVWHFAILVPDRFYAGIIGAFLAALAGALVTGFLLPAPGIPLENPPGVAEALWPIPGALLALALSYGFGATRSASPRRRSRDSLTACGRWPLLASRRRLRAGARGRLEAVARE